MGKGQAGGRGAGTTTESPHISPHLPTSPRISKIAPALTDGPVDSRVVGYHADGSTPFAHLPINEHFAWKRVNGQRSGWTTEAPENRRGVKIATSFETEPRAPQGCSGVLCHSLTCQFSRGTVVKCKRGAGAPSVS